MERLSSLEQKHSLMKISDVLREQLSEMFLLDSPLDDNINLMSDGIVDSYGLVEIINFIEDHYQITLEDKDLSSPQMKTINGLATLIERKLIGRNLSESSN